jgi:hypothetical protein
MNNISFTDESHNQGGTITISGGSGASSGCGGRITITGGISNYSMSWGATMLTTVTQYHGCSMACVIPAEKPRTQESLVGIQCTCEMQMLMRRGCGCGAAKAELA